MNSTCKTWHGEQYDKLCPKLPDRCFRIGGVDDDYEDLKNIKENFDCENTTFTIMPVKKELTVWMNYPAKPSFNYSEGGYQCKSGFVIPITLRCDGNYDCDDNSDEGDENNCPNLTKTGNNK